MLAGRYQIKASLQPVIYWRVAFVALLFCYGVKSDTVYVSSTWLRRKHECLLSRFGYERLFSHSDNCHMFFVIMIGV